MELPSHVVKNQTYWDRTSDDYQRMHAEQLGTNVAGWGVWGISEDELHVLGDVAGKDVLEFGCGGAQWSIFLAKRGARPVGLDISETQLSHARELMAKAGVSFPLIHASAESAPLPNASFDIVFCDHGAMTFADPRRTVPEAARLLRQGGAFAFNMSSPLRDACWNAAADRIESSLQETTSRCSAMKMRTRSSFNYPTGLGYNCSTITGLRSKAWSNCDHRLTLTPRIRTLCRLPGHVAGPRRTSGSCARCASGACHF